MYQVIKKTEKYLKGKRTIKNDFDDFRKNSNNSIKNKTKHNLKTVNKSE